MACLFSATSALHCPVSEVVPPLRQQGEVCMPGLPHSQFPTQDTASFIPQSSAKSPEEEVSHTC